MCASASLLDAGSCAHTRKEFLPRAAGTVFVTRATLRDSMVCGNPYMPGKLTNKLGIRIALGSAKLMIEMTNVRTPTEFHQHIEQRNRIWPAGNADEELLLRA